jgi:phosphatidylglycerophosphatase A
VKFRRNFVSKGEQDFECVIMNFVHYFIVFSIIFLADRLSKIYMLAIQEYPISSWLHFSVSFNRGMCWGMLHNAGNFCFVVISLLIVAFIGALMWYTVQRYREGNTVFGEILVLAGATSNFVDRVWYGGVVDFIIVSYKTWVWPTFNLADVAIVIGAVFMIVLSFDTKFLTEFHSGRAVEKFLTRIRNWFGRVFYFKNFKKIPNPLALSARVAGVSKGSRLASIISSCGPLGYLPASGTIISFITMLAWLWIPWLSSSAALMAMCAIAFLAVMYTPREAHDPSWIVIDEVVGMMTALYALPHSWPVVLGSFIIFRISDITKWGPVGWAEKLPGSLGIIADDFVAGIIANIIMRGVMMLW